MRYLILTDSSLDSMWMSLARFWTAVKMMVLTSLMIEPSWSASFSMEMTSSSSPPSFSTTCMMKPSVAPRRTWRAVSLLRRASWMARREAAKTRTFFPRKDSMASMVAMSEGSATATMTEEPSSSMGTKFSRYRKSTGKDWMRSRSMATVSSSMNGTR